MRHIFLAVVLVALAGAALGVRAQGQPEVKSSVNYVEVPVRVAKDNGAFVSGLRLSDFDVSENGRAQALVNFEEVRVEGSRGSASARRVPAPAGVPESVLVNEQRAFFLVVDDSHLSRDVAPKTSAALRAFVQNQISPADFIGLAYTSGARPTELTHNRSAILDEIDRLHVNNDPRDARPIRERLAMNAMAVVTAVVDALGQAAPGQRAALVLVTSGLDCVSSIRASDDGTILCGSQATAAIQRAVASGVTIYAIDPAGAVNPHFESPGTSRDGRNGPSQNGMELWRSSQVIDDAMRVLAAQTGGFTVTNLDQLTPGLERIARETGSFYRIGYYSTSDPYRVGQGITVSVKRRGMKAFYPTSRPAVH